MSISCPIGRTGRGAPLWVRATASAATVLLLWGAASAGSLVALECDHSAHDAPEVGATSGHPPAHHGSTHELGPAPPTVGAEFAAECGHCPQERCGMHAACGATAAALRSLCVGSGSASSVSGFQDAPYAERHLETPATLATPPPRIAA